MTHNTNTKINQLQWDIMEMEMQLKTMEANVSRLRCFILTKNARLRELKKEVDDIYEFAKRRSDEMMRGIER